MCTCVYMKWRAGKLVTLDTLHPLHAWGTVRGDYSDPGAVPQGKHCFTSRPWSQALIRLLTDMLQEGTQSKILIILLHELHQSFWTWRTSQSLPLCIELSLSKGTGVCVVYSVACSVGLPSAHISHRSIASFPAQSHTQQDHLFRCSVGAPATY